MVGRVIKTGEREICIKSGNQCPILWPRGNQRRLVELIKSFFKGEAPVLPPVHPLAILGVMPFSIVLPGANRFPASETLCTFSHIVDVSLAFVPVAEGVSAHAAVPLPSRLIQGGYSATAAWFGGRFSTLLWGRWFLGEWSPGR